MAKRLDRRFKKCVDCDVALTLDNVSELQPIRCQPCFDQFAGRTTETLKTLADELSKEARPDA